MNMSRDLYTLAHAQGKALFTMRQRAQLQTYVDYCTVRNQALTTDDSFVFSKLCTQLRTSIDELPDVEVGEADEWAKARAGEAVSSSADGEEDLQGAYSDLQMLASRREYLLDFVESLQSVKHMWARSSIEVHSYTCMYMQMRIRTSRVLAMVTSVCE